MKNKKQKQANPITAEEVKRKYFKDLPTEYNDAERQHIKNHLLHLAKSEQTRRTDGTYKNGDRLFLENSLQRVYRYILTRTEEERHTTEYNIFMESMNKSIKTLSEVLWNIKK